MKWIKLLTFTVGAGLLGFLVPYLFISFIGWHFIHNDSINNPNGILLFMCRTVSAISFLAMGIYQIAHNFID